MDAIRTIAVLGAGVMGRGIALVFAQGGYPTRLYDVNAAVLADAGHYVATTLQRAVDKGRLTPEAQAATQQHLRYTTDPGEVYADLIVEAVPESLELKHRVLAPFEAQNEPHTILASNTSTLPVTRIAAGLSRPTRMVGMHFFNPAPVMPLVEIISGAQTDPAVAVQVFDLAQTLGKQPVHAADTPGFIVNRVARHFYLESLRLLEEGVADHAAIDRLMRSTGFRMGPFELMDLIGVETNHAVTCSMYEAFFHDEKFRPSRIQQQLVDAGHFGRKTGRGFYSY